MRVGPIRAGEWQALLSGTFALALILVAAATGFAQAAVWTSNDIRVSELSSLSLTTVSGQAAAMFPDGSIYAVWYQRTGNRSSIIRGAARSPDGEWLERDVRISLGDSLVRNPTVAIGPSGDVYVVWEDLRHGAGEEIYYRHRDPAGSWGPEERLTAGDFPSLSPVIAAASDGRVHLVWSDGISGNFEIYHRYRDADGIWSGQRRLTNHPGISRTPVLAVDGGGVHVVWQDNVVNPSPGEDTNNTEIYYLHLDPNGEPMGGLERVSNALGSSRNPAMAVALDGTLHIFWCDNRDPAPNNPDYFPFAIWYRRKLPTLGFGHEKRFVYSISDHLFPNAAVAPDGTVNVVWEDYAHGNSEVYFRQIRAATGWEVPIRLTETVGPTRNPTILADAGQHLHLIWSDTSPGEEASVRYRLGQVDSSTPVVLGAIGAAWAGENLLLAWETLSETNHAGFIVQAAGELSDEPETIVMSPIVGGPRYETRLPASALEGKTVLKLVAIDRDGSIGTVAVLPVPRRTTRPVAGGLMNAYPNPSPGLFTVPVRLENGARAGLELIDVSGRRVASIDLGHLPPGTTDVSWSPLPDARETANGRYWLRLVADGRVTGGVVPILVVR